MNRHDGTNNTNGQENQSPPVPLERFPPVWSGAGHTDSVIGACELSDGRLLSWSEDNTLRLWSIAGEELRVLAGHTSYVNGACELSDGRLLSWSIDDTLRLWSSAGEELKMLTGHTSSVVGASELSDGRLLSWSSDRTLRLWSIAGDELRVLTGHTDTVWGARELSDGRLLSWSDDHTLRLWSGAGEELRVLTGHTDDVEGACELSDGRLLSWSKGSYDKALRLWSCSGEESRVLTGHSRYVGGAVQLNDGRLLSWSGDGTLRLWSSAGEELRVLTGHSFDVDGAIELSDGRLLSWSGDGTLRVWSSAGDELKVLSGQRSSVAVAGELSDGRLLSWGDDEALRLWSSEGEELRVLVGHTDKVREARELSDGRLLSWSKWDLFSSSDDPYHSRDDHHTLRLWSRTGELQSVVGVFKSGEDPLSEIAGGFSLLFVHEGKVIRGYSYTTDAAVTWQMSPSSGDALVRENKPQPDPKKAAAAIARTIKKYAGESGGSDGPESDTAVYLSIHSSWATEVLLELDRNVLPHIRGIQCTDAGIYEEITGVMPEFELDLLQLSFLPGTEVVNTLYGVQARRVLLFGCGDLKRLEGGNCAIPTVEVIDCPNLEQVHVTGPAGEAEVVYK
jgi:hypothetical protein